MKFFLDTANVEEIRAGVELGLVDGVTTNPTLVAKEGKNLGKVAQEICQIVDGPISLEVTAVLAAQMVEEARQLAQIHRNVVVKIPLIREGLKALKTLSQENIRVNATLVFSPLQALLAAKNGAAYVSPFIGRLDDIASDGLGVVADIIQIYDAYGYETEVIVASVRHPIHVLEAAKMGADIVTLPYKVLEQMIRHPLTDVGLEKFLADWKRLEEGGR